MFILNNIDDDLRVLIDLDDNSDVNGVGVDTLPYTFVFDFFPVATDSTDFLSFRR